MEKLKNKKILITSYGLASFGGAELNAVELADQLVDFGMKPTFFTYDDNGPLKDYIEDRFNTTILTDRVETLTQSDDLDDMGVTKLNIEDFDYIWVGGNTIPISIIKQINSAKKLPKFIFIHMSPLVGFPLDAPLMPTLEKQLASRILSISSTTTVDCIERILGKSPIVEAWPNPVPIEFKNLKKRTGTLKRIAVISSSHPGSEIIDIKPLIEKEHIDIDYIGKYNNNVKVVDADFYNEYDLIIGIGKNVRYSLVSGVPVYIYGRFGGGGYINSKNFNTNEAYNFSGRGFQKKTAAEIADEIVSGYDQALQFHESHREKFISELSIDNVAKKLFTDLENEPNKKVKFDENYINWLISMQINLLQRHTYTSNLRTANSTIRKLRINLKQSEENIKTLEEKLSCQIREKTNLLQSRSWAVTRPMRFVIGKVRAIKSNVKVKRS